MALLNNYINLYLNNVKDDDICNICTFYLNDISIYDSQRSNLHLYQLRDCKHIYHKTCLEKLIEYVNSEYIQCPLCKKIYGTKIGNQPDIIKMKHIIIKQKLPSYQEENSIQITYYTTKSNGIQNSNHPNPGKPFYCSSFPRIAYLPNNEQGNKVLEMLKKAFTQKLIFTIGRSVTTGEENIVTWNDIHHKTNIHGEYGYPDINYLDKVMSDLNQHGIQ